MEPFLKRRFSNRAITTIMLALLGLILAFGIQIFSRERAIAIQPETTQLICSSTPNLSPEQLSAEGRTSYEQGHFDTAIDCWQRATAAYHQAGNDPESVNNRINQAQAEQALGLYPRACNTLVQIYGQEDCTTFLQDEKKREDFKINLGLQANSPAKMTGLHSFGNVLREMGELDLSHQVLLLSLDNNQTHDQTAIWLDLGNTRRALSNKEQDLYDRTQDQQNIVCALIDAYVAEDAYQQALDNTSFTSNSKSVVAQQAQLNQLSLLLDIKDWRNKIQKQTNQKDDVLEQVFRQPQIFLLKKEENCWNQLTNPKFDKPRSFEFKFTKEVRDWLNQQLSSQNPLIQLPQIDNLQQQVEQLPPSHTTLYTRLNFAHNLMRLQDVPGSFQKVELFLNTTIDQAKATGNLKVESYALGYLGKLFEDSRQWELAKTKTQLALLIAQSIPSPDIMYQWQWQLGRIYKSEASTKGQASTKELQDDLKEARSAYQGAFQTLESLRRELATASSDTQFSFQNDTERVYRQYIDLLLHDQEPAANFLSKAREVIASLQAVELENFLRQACPEYNVREIDQIIDERAKNTAFLSPIVLEDRVEVILKLPTNSTNQEDGDQQLKHYKTFINRTEVEKQIRKLQVDLEEEYTFDDVTNEASKVYEWLLKGSEEYLSQDINTLVFALDTNLRNIPLAALVYDNEKISNKPKYLIEKYAIALSPRLSIPTPTVLKDRKIKVLAAGLAEPEPKFNQQQKQKFSRLNYVKAELDALNDIEKSNSQFSVTELENENFKTENLQSNINYSDFQILHLATHGEFSSIAENTFILAFDKLIRVNELDKVFKKQAQNQQEPIELLVLSACETASGDQRATLGLSGVAVRAGARSAIASLWTLDDQNSVEFTKNFYKYLINNPNQTKAQALQNTQKYLMKKLTGREHPRYWAPYILVGNWL